jgi:flagella basal body P-ring formation protein FlgA
MVRTLFCEKQHHGIVFSIAMALILAIYPVHADTVTESISISIPAKVEVDGADVVLGQLGHVTATERDLTKQVEAVTIGRAPQAGHSRTISRNYILLRLRQSGFDPNLIAIKAPEKIVLSRRAVTISAVDLEMMVRAYIADNPPFRGADMTITSVRIPGEVLLPTGDVHHEIQYLPQSRASGTLPLNIFFSIDGTPIKRILVTANITLMKDVPVTRRPIARYQLIQAEDLMMQTMDVTDLPANTVFAFEDIKGQRARRNIGPRTVLRKDQLEFPPAVKKGDRVLIVAESGGLRITTTGEVKSQGKVGDRVKVENLDSNKTLFARVIDARTVKVEF